MAATNQFAIDIVAATLYLDDTTKELRPVMCFGDGNYLFRAVSTILFGSEDHHTELRMRSILELANKEKKGFRRELSAIFNGRTCSRQKFVAKLRPLYLKESFFMLPERSTKNYLIQYLCQYVAYFCSCQCPWFSCAFGVPCCTKCWHR